MKKLLVASTALVAFAAVNTASAADPISIKVGGYMNQYVGYTDQDEDGTQKFTNVNINSESEVYFRGSTKLDNGLTISVNIDAYADRDDSFGGDDVFLQIASDSMGRVRIGQTKGAAYALSHSAPNVALGNTDGDVDDWLNNPGSVTSDQTMTASEANDGQKIVYWTPNLGGFTAGVSYGVDVNSAGLESVIDLGTNDLNGDGTTGDYANRAWDAGIAYNGDLGGVSVGADVTYQRNFQGGLTGTGVADRTAWRAGLSVSAAGFTVGGSYRDTNNEGYTENLDANGWDIGVSYATGPYGVSLSYSSYKQDTAANATTEAEAERWVLGGSYDMGAGVTLVGSVFGAEYDDGLANGANQTTDNEGFGVVTGLKVSF